MIEGGITLCLSKRVVCVDDQQKNLGIDNGIGNLLEHFSLPNEHIFSIEKRDE